MAITYECNLAQSGTSLLKDCYRNIVFGNTTGMTVGEVAVFHNRCTINEGRWLIDEANTTIYVYADFTLATTLATSDYWLLVTLVGFSSQYLPQYTNTTRSSAVLVNDLSSTVTTNSFFVYSTSSNNGIFVHKGDAVTQDDHYIVYGAWQY